MSTFSSSPAPASPMSTASAQLPIHTAQTLESSLRTSIAGISAQGSQEIDQLLQSDAWILSSPLKGPPPSPVVERPHTPIRRAVGMIVLSPLSPPPALNQDIALQVLLSLGMTHKNIMKDLPFREDKAIEAVQAGNMTIKAAGDRYAIPPRTLGDRLSGKLAKADSAKARRLLNEVEDIVLHEFILLQIELGFPPTIDMIQRAATSLVQRKKAHQLGLPRGHDSILKLGVGKNWVGRWLDRNPEVYARRVRALESKRAVQSTPEMCYGFLEKVSAVCKEYNIAPCDISNMDEKGFACGGTPRKATYAVIPRGHLSITRIETGNRRWITSLEFVTGDGVCGLIYIIKSGKVMIQDSAAAIRREFGSEPWKLAVSSIGWSDAQHSQQ
jgi:hypothetical protein